MAQELLYSFAMKQTHVLIIDNNSTMANLYSRMLEKAFGTYSTITLDVEEMVKLIDSKKVSAIIVDSYLDRVVNDGRQMASSGIKLINTLRSKLSTTLPPFMLMDSENYSQDSKKENNAETVSAKKSTITKTMIVKEILQLTASAI
jgi:CheY-like chemotaxis protein